MSNIDREALIRELSRLRHKRAGDNILICCPNPEHNDKNPSCSVYIGRPTTRKPLGVTYCWSCGFKASWNKVAGLLNLNALTGELVAEKVDRRTREELLPPQMTMRKLLSIMNCKGKNPIPVPSWRGVSKSTLKRCGAFYTNYCPPPKEGMPDRLPRQSLLLPCVVEGNIVGGVRANIKRTRGLNYINSPGTWSHQSGLLFYDVAMEILRSNKSKALVVVEGPRDALFLIENNIPAVAILGAKNFHELKAVKLLEAPKVIVFMDSDEAGVQATNAITSAFKKTLGVQYKPRVAVFRTALYCERLGLDASEGYDAASMTPELKEKFLRFYHKHAM